MAIKLDELDLDIKRCDSVLIENNYLEIVIAIEELCDKYKDTIQSIANISSNVVWNYSKKDIKNICNYLKEYKEELILKNKQKSIEEKLNDLKVYIDNNYTLEKDKLIEMIKLIEDTNNANLSLDEKWDKIKNFLELIVKQEREVGTQLLDIILLTTK